jgi:hypothetical protein
VEEAHWWRPLVVGCLTPQGLLLQQAAVDRQDCNRNSLAQCGYYYYNTHKTSSSFPDSSFGKFEKDFNSFGAQTDSSPFGKFKKFSILLELKQNHSPFGKFPKFSILLELKQILLHSESSKSFQFLWSSNCRLETSKMLEPPTYVLQKSKHHIIGSC